MIILSADQPISRTRLSKFVKNHDGFRRSRLGAGNRDLLEVDFSRFRFDKNGFVGGQIGPRLGDRDEWRTVSIVWPQSCFGNVIEKGE